MMRKSIRPVTLRRVIEVCSIALKEGVLDPAAISGQLNTTQRRSVEILSELQRMNALTQDKEGFFRASIVTKDVIRAYQNENWNGIHQILAENYDFYGAFVTALSRNALTKDELLSKLSADVDLNFNATAVDILCDWAERLGQVQRNLYNSKYYLLRERMVGFGIFLSEVQRCYNALNYSPRPGMKLVYTEIARLRESVCEALRIRREAFDDLLRELIRKFTGKVELSGAPVTTSAKKSPSSLRTMEKGEPHPILSPTFVSIREGKGLDFHGKLYQYIAVFEQL
jgi:hypothetical protein